MGDTYREVIGKYFDNQNEDDEDQTDDSSLDDSEEESED